MSFFHSLNINHHWSCSVESTAVRSMVEIVHVSALILIFFFVICNKFSLDRTCLSLIFINIYRSCVCVWLDKRFSFKKCSWFDFWYSAFFFWYTCPQCCNDSIDFQSKKIGLQFVIIFFLRKKNVAKINFQ